MARTKLREIEATVARVRDELEEVQEKERSASALKATSTGEPLTIDVWYFSHVVVHPSHRCSLALTSCGIQTPNQRVFLLGERQPDKEGALDF